MCCYNGCKSFYNSVRMNDLTRRLNWRVAAPCLCCPNSINNPLSLHPCSSVGFTSLCQFTGGVTEAAARGISRPERGRWEGRRRWWRRWRERWHKCKRRLWARGPLQPQPGSHGACAAAGTGGVEEATRAPDEGVGKREEQAAAGGDPGHHTRSARPDVGNAT